jgi:hypothetical protein
MRWLDELTKLILLILFSRLGNMRNFTDRYFMKHPILKSVLVALIPIGHRSIPNNLTITQLLDGDIGRSPISLFPHPITIY